jgi:GTP-binding protein Era
LTTSFLLRGGGSNSRPSGYEPDELPLLYLAMWSAKVALMNLSSKQILLFYLCRLMKSGFVNIFGKPNAGKSTLMNALVGEKMAIVSPKVQTTRHRIRAFLNGAGYQIIFSDTPGIIEPEYKLHEKMMHAVKSSLEDADLALLLVDVRNEPETVHAVFEGLRLRVPAFVVLNKIDQSKPDDIQKAIAFFEQQRYCKKVITISAAKKVNLDILLKEILEVLPEGEPFFGEDDITDMPSRFFVGELIREKIYELFDQEIPYQTAVQVTDFKEKQTLIKITAEIIVQRESQKAILLGQGGKTIKQLGTMARKEIEAFLDSKIFLELFVKVRPKWRDNDMQLKEYGYV